MNVCTIVYESIHLNVCVSVHTCACFYMEERGSVSRHMCANVCVSLSIGV